MPVYDYECTNKECGLIKEFILKVDECEQLQDCPECGHWMVHIITASGQFCSNEDATWLKSVVDVVDKEGGPAAREFIKNPTRRNYKHWMKESGVRPLEPGEKMRPDPVNLDKVTDFVMRRHKERMTDEQYRRYNEKLRREKVLGY